MTTTPSLMPLDPSKIVNVFVHGLFFMRLGADLKTIELIVPPVPLSPEHKFLGGVRTKLQKLIPPLVDWRNIGLDGTTATKPNPGQMPAGLPPTIPQFSVSTTGLKDFNEAKFVAKVILPWPKDFFTVRCGNFDKTFLFDPAKPVIGPEIKKRCQGGDPAAEVGFITCLQYTSENGVKLDGWTRGKNVHVYFEPCTKHKIIEVNQDLKKAADIFVAPNNFDLEMLLAADHVVISRPSMCKRIPPGFNKDEDDFSLHEDPEPKNQGICPKVVPASGLNPSNCPNFFVGP